MATSHRRLFALKLLAWILFFFLLASVLLTQVRLLGGWYAYYAEYIQSFRSRSRLGPKCNGILNEPDCWHRGFPNRWWFRRMRCEGELYGSGRLPGVFDKLWNAIPGLPNVPSIGFSVPRLPHVPSFGIPIPSLPKFPGIQLPGVLNWTQNLWDSSPGPSKVPKIEVTIPTLPKVSTIVPTQTATRWAQRLWNAVPSPSKISEAKITLSSSPEVSTIVPTAAYWTKKLWNARPGQSKVPKDENAISSSLEVSSTISTATPWAQKLWNARPSPSKVPEDEEDKITASNSPEVSTIVSTATHWPQKLWNAGPSPSKVTNKVENIISNSPEVSAISSTATHLTQKLSDGIPSPSKTPKVRVSGVIPSKETIAQVLQDAESSYDSLSKKISNALPDLRINDPRTFIIPGLARGLQGIGWTYGIISTRIENFFIAVQNTATYLIPQWAFPDFKASAGKYLSININGRKIHFSELKFSSGWARAISEFFEDATDWITESWIWRNLGFGYPSSFFKIPIWDNLGSGYLGSFPKTWIWEKLGFGYRSSVPTTWFWDNVVDWFLWQWCIQTILAYSLLALTIPISIASLVAALQYLYCFITGSSMPTLAQLYEYRGNTAFSHFMSFVWPIWVAVAGYVEVIIDIIFSIFSFFTNPIKKLLDELRTTLIKYLESGINLTDDAYQLLIEPVVNLIKNTYQPLAGTLRRACNFTISPFKSYIDKFWVTIIAVLKPACIFSASVFASIFQWVAPVYRSAVTYIPTPVVNFVHRPLNGFALLKYRLQIPGIPYKTKVYDILKTIFLNILLPFTTYALLTIWILDLLQIESWGARTFVFLLVSQVLAERFFVVNKFRRDFLLSEDATQEELQRLNLVQSEALTRHDAVLFFLVSFGTAFLLTMNKALAGPFLDKFSETLFEVRWCQKYLEDTSATLTSAFLIVSIYLFTTLDYYTVDGRILHMPLPGVSEWGKATFDQGHKILIWLSGAAIAVFDFFRGFLVKDEASKSPLESPTGSSSGGGNGGDGGSGESDESDAGKSPSTDVDATPNSPTPSDPGSKYSRTDESISGYSESGKSENDENDQSADLSLLEQKDDDDQAPFAHRVPKGNPREERMRQTKPRFLSPIVEVNLSPTQERAAHQTSQSATDAPKAAIAESHPADLEPVLISPPPKSAARKSFKGESLSASKEKEAANIAKDQEVQTHVDKSRSPPQSPKKDKTSPQSPKKDAKVHFDTEVEEDITTPTQFSFSPETPIDSTLPQSHQGEEEKHPSPAI